MNFSNRLVSLILGIVSCFTAQAFESEYGPKLNSKISGTNLVMQDGALFDFEKEINKGPIAFVFFRSADW